MVPFKVTSVKTYEVQATATAVAAVLCTVEMTPVPAPGSPVSAQITIWNALPTYAVGDVYSVTFTKAS